MSVDLSEYNADELTPPIWLNSELFAEILEKHEQVNGVELIDVDISPATKKGDHYASIMFRARVTYKLPQCADTKSLSLIVKCMPEEDGMKKDMLKDTAIFETEIGMYTEVLPRFEAILREVGDSTKLCNKCIYHGLAPHKYIVFEDVVPLGYGVLRYRLCNFEEAKIVYSKLAKWQAISYKLALEEPKYLENYNSTFWDSDAVLQLDFLTKGIKNFIHLLDAHTDLRQYKPLFKAISETLLKRATTTIFEYRRNKRPDGIYVLTHGDYHVKNIMEKFDESTGELQDVMLLDFQMCNMGPITIDLLNGKYSMLSPEVRLQRMDELLYYYHETFVNTLKKIGFEGEIPTLWHLRQELFRHRIHELFLLSTFLPMSYASMKPDFDPSDLLENPAAQSASYGSNKMVEELKVLLPKLLHQGYFEELVE